MEALLQFLQASSDLDSLVSTVVSNCSTKTDAHALAAICKQHHQAIEGVIKTFMAPENSMCRTVVPTLMADIPSVSELVWQCAADQLAQENLDTVQYYLDLIEFLLVQTGSELSAQLVNALYKQLSSDEDQVADIVSRILNTRAYPAGSCAEWWSQIQARIASPTRNDIQAYKVWLSWVVNGPTELLDVCQTEEYWQLLQDGISATPRSTERIKYCLQILAFSLENLEVRLDLDYMKWDPTSKSCRAVWTRYVALTEIISVDLSYNQADESRDDLFTLCQDPSIPASWVLSLLKSGLSTQAENIRTFVVDAIFQFPDLSVFNYDVTVLVKYLLPLASAPARFVLEDQMKCDYIDTFSDFVLRLLQSLTSDNRAEFFGCLLDDYQQSVFAYDGPRLILLDAATKFDSLHLPLVVLEKLGKYANSARRVSKSKALGGMIFRKSVQVMVQSLHLQLLPLYFPNLETFPFLDIVLQHIDEHHKHELKVLAEEKAVYYIVYYHKWGLLDTPAHPQADLIVSHLQQPVLGSAMSALAKRQLSQGCLSAETRDALSIVDAGMSLPTQFNGSPLEQAVAQMQLSSLINPDALAALEQVNTEFPTSTGHERLLNAQRIQYALGQLSCDFNTAIPIIEKAFSFDYKPTQIASLCLLRRYLDAGQTAASKTLGSTLIAMWECLNENGLRASDRDLHVSYINTVFSSHLFADSHLSPALEQVAISIIKQSYARKNLLVPLVEAICRHKSLPIWAYRALVNAYTLIRTHHDIFYLEDIILERFGVYTEYWGKPERVARAFAISKLAAAEDMEEIADIVLKSDFKLFHTTNYHDGDEECVRILCFQILVLLEPKWSSTYLEKLVPSLLQAVDNESSKFARIYIEWLLTSAIVRNIELINSVLIDSLCNNTEPRFVSSLGRAGLLVGRALGERIPEDYWNNYANVIVPLSTSNKAAVRHFSVAMVYALSIDPALQTHLDPKVLALVKGIAQCASNSDQFSNFKQGDDCVFDTTDHSLPFVCGGVIERLYQYHSRVTISPGTFDLACGGAMPVSGAKPAQASFASVTTIRDCVSLTENIQTKSGASGQRSELIVVASLCDIAVNLGGICRLSDALGVKLLTLDDLKVTKSAHFKNTAVTADRWMPLEEVKQDDVADFMLKMKRQGYTLVGLEQTDNSFKLEPSLKFPPKTLLLIGRERLGIPGNLLTHLDFCVEIEQFGVVRSMNVQTATAVIVHAYNHQH